MNRTTVFRNSMADILKGICIIIIIITHYNWAENERLTYLFPFWIDMAVPIFIIISGYVYSMSYERNGIQTLTESYGYRFVINKIVRYTIPFVMAYAVEIVVAVIFKTMSIYGMVVSFIDGGVGPGSYYYPIMIQFIFVFPFIYFLIKKYDFIGVIICFLINGMYEIIQRSYGMSEGNYRLLLFRYIFLMSVGCYMYIGKRIPKFFVGIVSMIVGAGWLVMYQYLGYQPKVIIYWSGTCLFAALWITPIAWGLIKNSKISQIKCKLLEKIGKASYNIFLTQMVFYTYAAGTLYSIVQNRVLQLCICICTNTVVGYIFYLVESRITKIISQKIKEHDFWALQIQKVFKKTEAIVTK